MSLLRQQSLNALEKDLTRLYYLGSLSPTRNALPTCPESDVTSDDPSKQNSDTAFAFAVSAPFRVSCDCTNLSSWSPVPPADLSKLKPSDFADDELDLPYYLAHFHRLANGVVETGDNRGFINVAVWRNLQDNKPYNARIMENILSLAFFYCTKRPWNQYYASPAVRMRLEAALDFWCRMQNSDGRFSEYGPQRWNLPATAFATKFMGETLRLLHNGPPIDGKLLQRVLKANRAAIRVVLTDPALLAHGKNFTNQYTNVFAGGLAFLSLYPDAQFSAAPASPYQGNQSRVFQSPVGYFYEARGPDWGYNLGTHHSNLTDGLALHTRNASRQVVRGRGTPVCRMAGLQCSTRAGRFRLYPESRD